MKADNDIRFALLGGTTIGAPALLRAYVWHCIAIPVIASGLMMMHFGECVKTAVFQVRCSSFAHVI